MLEIAGPSSSTGQLLAISTIREHADGQTTAPARISEMELFKFYTLAGDLTHHCLRITPKPYGATTAANVPQLRIVRRGHPAGR